MPFRVSHPSGRIACLPAAGLAAWLSVSCSSPEAASRTPADNTPSDNTPSDDTLAVEVTDDRGASVRLEAPARRIVSVLPSMTEIVVALGTADRLVARTRYDRAPSLEDLPSLGSTIRPSLEAIAALAPDLVLAWDDDEGAIGDRMAAIGIPVYHASVSTLAELDDAIRKLGILLGREAAAEHLRASIRQRLAAVRASIPPGPRPDVFYVVWHDPPQTAGPGTFLDDLIEIAGGTNAFSDTRTPWPRVSLEEVVRRDPDVLVVAGHHDGSAAETTWLRRPGWRQLTAVREERVLLVDADLFNRPGPRVAEAAEILAEFLADVRE